MIESERKIGLILLGVELFDAELVKKAEIQCKKSGKRFTEVLVSLGVDAAAIRQALAMRLRLPEFSLHERKVDPDVVKLIPQAWAQQHGILPLERVGNTLTLGMVNPFNVDVIKDIKFKTGLNLRIAAIAETELPAMIEKCYSDGAPVPEFNMDQVELLAAGPEEEESDEEGLVGLESDAPIIRLVDRIIQDAVRARATDIHIEPGRGGVHVRYRIDGVMTDILDIPKYVQGPFTSRIKIMGSMDIADKRKPQDGRSKIRVGTKLVDLRISSLPTMYGEKIVLRLLEQAKGAVSVGDVGFSPAVLGSFNRLLDYPQGMILVTGPTGSGKTTTLYSALSRLNDGTTNIVTVEDPVEYQVSGINQVQINIRAGMTFASGLRSILRQDPDVILVGEMRDLETAEIAFHAAQTGHLVLSTLHTNDAASSVTRLQAIGIDPYLIAASILGIMAQRLVRQLCTKCKRPVAMDGELQKWVSPDLRDMPHQLFESKGCKECRETGFFGRFPISEILVPNDTVRDFIVKGRSDREILNIARQAGTKTIFEDGIERILQGLTTFEEVTRVVAPPPSPSPEERTKVSLMKTKESV
jgi:type IV pilus assembly protein PilB